MTGDPGRPSPGPSPYDDAAAFDRYRRHRHGGAGSPNAVMEEPAVLDVLGDVAGLRILDLGCGDGTFGRALLERDAASYLGVDASERMVDAARGELRGTPGRVLQASIETFAAPPARFDLVVSRLALHYVADLGAALAACRRALAGGGRLVLSVVHPVLTAAREVPDRDGPRTSWVVDDYFRPGARTRPWLGGTVVWHHRTVEEHVAALADAGFTLTALRECPPRRDRFGDDEAEFARRCRVPLFLLLGAQAAPATAPAAGGDA